ncbi:MAG: molecular chaperone DnaJ [Candidatus Doudnabacteria bacterium RIFCSPHIGHO2_01_FULL_50_11]|uniref:Chaperone protein DnaJ n=1 Tax=Candidatus Doudnabacteria bacterium RIFCSPHIGHO2_01_FULL_50_11 TaxID=1817828 RepID=A0A1F5PG46_9BACT|nr:MAG: molecular chaperone DnaJ [Candidatus Doudnabacteria bacterium RIFCSPHIGHO2_01_FULL_50_11]HLC44987.1 molecular chaperone DnaJ [Patescibacteria group bacterium]
MADYYDTLGVSRRASADDIKRAYRKLAHEHHPDKTGGDDKKFREINEAYQVLSDPSRRSQYDQFGRTFQEAGSSGGDPFSDFARGFGGFSQGQGSGDFGFDFGDIFSDIFGFGGNASRPSGRARGIDLQMDLVITFGEAVFGTEKDVSLQKLDTCPMCGGSGAEPGAKLATCGKCHGQGQIKRMQRTILGSIATSTPCDECGGRGKIPEASCKTCGGRGTKQQIKTIKVVIPPGIDDGQRIRLTGQGEAGYLGSAAGDLFINIKVQPHPTLRREGNHIVSEVPISFYQAALGTKIQVETLDGPVELRIPAGTQSGKIFRLRGRGVAHLGTKRRGDQLVTVRIITPTKLSRKEKELLQQMAQEKGEFVDVERGMWDKIKNQFE